MRPFELEVADVLSSSTVSRNACPVRFLRSSNKCKGRRFSIILFYTETVYCLVYLMCVVAYNSWFGGCKMIHCNEVLKMWTLIVQKRASGSFGMEKNNLLTYVRSCPVIRLNFKVVCPHRCLQMQLMCSNISVFICIFNLLSQRSVAPSSGSHARMSHASRSHYLLYIPRTARSTHTLDYAGHPHLFAMFTSG